MSENGKNQIGMVKVKMSEKSKKKPLLAALINLVLPGAGYLYLGGIGRIEGLLALFAFAYDAFMECKSLKKWG